MRRFALILLTLAVLLPATARAYVPSPQYGAFELKFGPYTPNVDQEPSLNGATPYKDTLKNDWMFLTALELDWQFLRVPWVSFGLGGQVGFMQAYAKAVNEYGVESAEYTVLNVIPTAILGVIRIDGLADEVGVPLVPFVKGGINWYLWWVLGGGGDVASSGGEKAFAGTMGWQVSGGMMFRLDPLDERTARTFDNEAGVNHSYIFVEYLYAVVEGFDREGYLYLSPTDLGDNGTFLIGLGLEF